MKRCLLLLFFLLAVFCLCSINNDVFAYDFSAGHYIQNVIRSKLELGLGYSANFTDFFRAMNNNDNMFWNIYKDAFGNGNTPSYFPANFDITKYDCFVYSINSGSTYDSSNYRYNVIWINTVDHLDSIDYIKFDEQSGTMHAYAYEYSQNEDIDVNFGSIGYFSMCVWLQQDGQVHLYNHYGPFTPTTDNVSDIFNCSIYDFNKIYYYGSYDVYNTDGSTLYSLETSNTRPLPTDPNTPGPDVPINPDSNAFTVTQWFVYPNGDHVNQNCGYDFSFLIAATSDNVDSYDIDIKVTDANGITSNLYTQTILPGYSIDHFYTTKLYDNYVFNVKVTGYDNHGDIYTRVFYNYTSNYSYSLACSDNVPIIQIFPENPNIFDVVNVFSKFFNTIKDLVSSLPWFIVYPLYFMFAALAVIIPLKVIFS